ncbi:hypothetical protein H6G20_07105 [Desertifilum sp. FACHB-1129]|uniref:Uncharacterized protein n=2 Tax=Desertifilum tharense IPPAS B-1220 TaxID=1781255 RepID=A0A1E5QCZ4_9CYAN|nr:MULTISPECIES: hypothetical protein [Desertifilum]MCD8489147.1 hypothetical protein [Desertifilum sp.]MDA0212872.1 hypothetical protein [Cyanobacteria bacterium FC1]MBD2311425.1 hypothetical protein [Desertifilum sp. FACHB-1129]MBD2321671.1 hypothetical protein [Desertifilum sp. FACHB-866]MBD2331798.1 hypothetical protein [Desertifilum sp. FACHB-868]
MRIDEVKQAVLAAETYLKSLQGILNNRIENLAIEEVEKSEDNQFWLITLSFERHPKSGSILPGIHEFEREYKLFKINSLTKEVESMKVRVLRNQ